MDGQELLAQVRALRATGRSPKQIARALGVPPAAVAARLRPAATASGAAAWWGQGRIVAADSGAPIRRAEVRAMATTGARRRDGRRAATGMGCLALLGSYGREAGL